MNKNQNKENTNRISRQQCRIWYRCHWRNQITTT